MAGSSASQFEHHVAQNSTRSGLQILDLYRGGCRAHRDADLFLRVQGMEVRENQKWGGEDHRCQPSMHHKTNPT
jgi:hypothetical protein